jgi:hypothetical protein
MYMCTYIHTYIHTHTHTHIHTYTHTHTHTHVHTRGPALGVTHFPASVELNTCALVVVT